MRLGEFPQPATANTALTWPVLFLRRSIVVQIEILDFAEEKYVVGS